MNETLKKMLETEKAEKELRKKIIGDEQPPHCANCGRKLIVYKYLLLDPSRSKRWGYNGNNIFCTATCGFVFGLEAYKAGYRKEKR